jgi:hypothetical protein
MQCAEDTYRFDTKVVQNQGFRASSFSTVNGNAANMNQGVESRIRVTLRNKKSSQFEVVAEEI